MIKTTGSYDISRWSNHFEDFVLATGSGWLIDESENETIIRVTITEPSYSKYSGY